MLFEGMDVYEFHMMLTINFKVILINVTIVFKLDIFLELVDKFKLDCYDWRNSCHTNCNRCILGI